MVGSERRGMRVFAWIWSGQVLSLFGSALTRFGVGVWIYQQTGSVLSYGLIALFGLLPGSLLSPFAGVLVDRWDRRWTLVVSDAVGATLTFGLWFLARAGDLAAWHVYAVAAVASVSSAFQWPAFSAVTPLLVPKAQLARASGMVQTAMSGTQIAAPMLGGVLLARAGLPPLLMIDVATFGAAALALLTVAIPKPPASAAGRGAGGNLWRQAGFGWSYLRQRPGLFQLMFLFALINLGLGMVYVLLTPMVLGLGGPRALGGVLSAAAAATFCGGLAMSAWGGPRRRMPWILGGTAAGALCLAAAGLGATPTAVAVAACGFYFIVPVITSLSQALWQAKVEPDVLGRVFATRRMVATLAVPFAYLFGGQLADAVFEPLMAPGGAWTDVAGRWLGVGEGRGAALLLTLVALLLSAAPLAAFASPRIRHLESEIPDVGDEPPAEPAAATTGAADPGDGGDATDTTAAAGAVPPSAARRP